MNSYLKMIIVFITGFVIGAITMFNDLIGIILLILLVAIYWYYKDKVKKDGGTIK
ncbi:MAG: hypothetical protein QXH07_06100 [Thermoplasmata archaeon]